MQQYYPNWSPYSVPNSTPVTQQPIKEYSTLPQFPSSNNANVGLMAVMVGSLEAVENYPVAAGNTVLLMDFSSKKFWLKSTDASGFPQPLRSFEFDEKIQNGVEKADYVTRKEFDELKQMLEDLTR